MSAFIAVVLSAAVSLLLTPLMRRLAWRTGGLDHADGRRKLQAAPVPYLGGLAVFASLAAGAGYVWFVRTPSSDALGFVGSGALMCLVGWYDDRFTLRVRWKLAGQVVATLPLLVAGHTLTRLECCGGGIDLGWSGIPLTMIWLIAGANALNFLDGLDGLAATIALTQAAMTGVVACCLGDTDAMLFAAVLVGGLAGFLKFNWHPATIYLGDAGSMTVGLWLAALSLAAARTGDSGYRVVVAIALLAVPLSDVVLAVIRRMWMGRAFWLPDRGHIHHRLADRGWGVGNIVAVLAAISIAGGAVALAAVAGAGDVIVGAALVFGAVVLARFNLIGSNELELVSHSLASRLHAVDNRAWWQRRWKSSHVAHELQNPG